MFFDRRAHEEVVNGTKNQSEAMEYFMLSAYFGDFDGKVDLEANNCI
jgi:hypothetical protein